MSEGIPRLWAGDTGTLLAPSRRALVHLVRGPHLGAQRNANLWAALLNDEAEIRSRLADLFLDLVIDREAEIAFIRNATPPDLDVPQVVRTAPLTFLDTAALLHLRQLLLHGVGGERVIVGADELGDHLEVYRGKDKGDPALFGKRINATITKLEKYGILARTTTEGRYEISPVLRLVFTAEEVAAIHAEFRRIADGDGDGDGEGDGDGKTVADEDSGEETE